MGSFRRTFKNGIVHLVKYVEREGHAKVPSKHIEDEFKLGQWVGTRRVNYINKTLSEEKIKTLESFKGWTWDPSEEQFKNGIVYLVKYVESEGHAQVSAKHIEDEFKLGVWVSNQRAKYNRKRLSEERIKTLESFKGWIWDPKEEYFKNGIVHLVKYIEREGHIS